MGINIKIDYKAVEEIVRRAGRMIKEAYLSSDSVQHKEGDANFVTSYDVAIQKFLIDELHGIVPEAAFFGEEETEGNTRGKGGNGYCFYIDPIDGTTNFMFHYNFSCVSVGLAYQEKMMAGFVYNPYVDEMFTGIRGEGAFLNGELIHCGSRQSLDRCVVATGFPVDKDCNPDNNLDNVARILPQVRGLRRLGAAAVDISYVAAGILDAYWELNLHEWDVCAGLLIAEEAGAKYHYFRDDRNISVLVASPQILPQILPLLSNGK